MRRLTALPLLTAICLLLLASAVPSCSVRTTVPDGTGLASAVDNRAEALAPELAELEALPTPPGADPAQFAALKAEFRRLLLSGELKRKSAGKGTSAGLGVEVDDLNVTDNGGGNMLLSWSYHHQGDYDQNGEVNVADLSPIGMHFLQNNGGAFWQEARVADGDENGEVNVADLTPLGQNFGSLVTGYRVESTATPADPASFALVTEVPFSAGQFLMGNPFWHFSTTLNGQAAGLSYRVVAVWSGSVPAPSFDEVENNDSVAGAQALSGSVSGFTGSLGSAAGYSAYDGDSDDYFSFPAATGQDLDITLSLNSGTGDIDLYLLSSSGTTLLASEGTGNTEHILADVTGGGTFVIQARCYDGYSNYTLDLSITGGGANQPPDAALTGNPLTGASPLTVNWDASGSSDPDGSIVKYEWDWGDDGVWEFDSGTVPTVSCEYTGDNSTWTTRVRVTDDGGLSDTATVVVHTTGGGGFVEPPVENYTFLTPGGYSNPQLWLLNCYKPLPAWQDADRVFQSDIFRQWADEVLTLTNAQRLANGVTPPLTWDAHLELVAQAHARDMALEDFFDHDNKYGMSPFDRLDAVNRPAYTPGSDIAGENILAGRDGVSPYAGTPQMAMDWWMNSPGHRANILNPNVTYLGVGVYYLTGDSNGLYVYFVQLFANWSEDTTTHDWLEPAEVPAP